MVFTCLLLSLCKICSPFRENNNVVVFPFPFNIFMPLTNLWFIHLQGYFPILRTKSCPDLYPLIRTAGRSLVPSRGRILILEFIWSPPTLAVYDVAHSLPLRGPGKCIPFTEDKTQRHSSYLSQYMYIYMEIRDHMERESCKLWITQK